MKGLKVFGCAVLVALLLILAGGTVASATVLCKTQLTQNCGEWDYPAGTKFDASLDPGSSLTTEATGGSLEGTCSESTIKGETENTGSSSETVKIKVTELSFARCTKPTKVLNALGTLEFHWISGTDNATLTAAGFEITQEAISGVSCVYSAGTGTDLGTVTGGSMGTIDINAIVNKKSGSFLCPADSVWKASYTVTEPEPLYVATN
jgi:hypothetical protein